MRQQDDPNGLRNLQGRRVQREGRLQPAVEQAAVAEQGAKGHGDDHGRHDEGHGEERAQQRLAGEAVAGKNKGQGQTEQQRQRSGGGGLPGGEPKHAPEKRRAQGVADAAKIPRAVCKEADAQDPKQGVEIENGEEEQGEEE